MTTSNLMEDQKLAVRCAYADLVGVIQCLVGGIGTPDGIDTDAILLTLSDLADAFPDVVEQHIFEGEDE